ncbi:MAG: hypothetical protein A3H93_07485 [Rhodocyclales bacterium RIFCSPLOWO2_02_FULL_63_24]|nr:MAG: hypothetical protein A2040_04145 [Rhodocyclales bacterium GWA2_65_19]OHC69224.1 MAG: hypothetical protein A3H93_07485 [Rhodocyclales bacterium RIFCSPLOWO2_02_FULL_63_24]
MFDSPIDYCPVCGQMVLLDQTHAECAREHDCAAGTPCPLQQYFTGIDFSVEQPKEKLREQGY